VAAIHESGGKAVLQIEHGGRRVPFAVSEMSPITPYPRLIGGEMPREMSFEGIKSLQEDFVRASLKAKSSGFDAIEIYMCHGYLVHQLLSPLSNKRVDEYGGEVDGRAKSAIDTLRLVKEAVDRDFPVSCRISAEEKATGEIKSVLTG